MGAVSAFLWIMLIIDYSNQLIDLIFIPAAFLAGFFTALIIRHEFSNKLSIIYGPIIFICVIAGALSFSASLFIDNIEYLLIPVAFICNIMPFLGSWLTLKIIHIFKNRLFRRAQIKEKQDSIEEEK